jgi:hypothetical protein
MRTPFVAVLLIVCLIRLTSMADAAIRDFAGTYEKDRIGMATAGDEKGTRNPPLHVCETNRQSHPSRDAAQSETHPTSAKQASGVAVKFTRLSVKDPGANNIEAVSFLIPAGWKTEGGVRWFPNHLVLANLFMKITDPKTGAAIEFLPSQYFGWSSHPAMAKPQGGNYMGVIQWPPIRDPAEFIQTMYGPGPLRRLQGARILKTEDFPKVSAELSQYHGGQARCARVRYEYQDGRETWEEDVYVTLVHTPTQTGVFWSGSAHSFRAHRGQLDRLTPVMNTTINSNRQSPAWFAYYMYVRKLFLDRMAQGIRNAGILSEAITRNSSEIQKMYEDSYRKANQSQDRISRSYSEYIRGVETYRNPYEDRPIQLPTGYDGVWVNRSGEYILSNQSGFNPNMGSTQEWRRMEKSP